MKWTFIFLGMFFMLNCYGADDAKSSSQGKKLLSDVHPYAFYYLIGNDYSISDIDKGIISVNVTKLNITLPSHSVIRI